MQVNALNFFYRKKKVPDLLLATIEPLEGLPVIGRSCLIHVFVTRPKQHARGELNACFVSDSLPFIEYDIYKQLVNKLRVNGMNAILGLKVRCYLFIYSSCYCYQCYAIIKKELYKRR